MWSVFLSTGKCLILAVVVVIVVAACYLGHLKKWLIDWLISFVADILQLS